jgi:hypothetical protein
VVADRYEILNSPESIGNLFVCLASFVVIWIEKIKPIITVVSDQSGFDLNESNG